MLNIVFVENVFEELDAPSEWYLDRANSVLYFYPPTGLDLENAVVETVRLKHLVEFRGSQASPRNGSSCVDLRSSMLPGRLW